MQSIKELIKKRVIPTQSTVAYNSVYEDARRIADLIQCNPLIILRLQKKYGKEKMLGLYSWLKDYPNLDLKKAVGLLIWKLKQS